MVNYGNGKIYKIVSNQTDKVYIGSTTKKYLSQRMQKHRASYRLWKEKSFHYLTSFDILQYDDAEIILIENSPCTTKDELCAREKYYIKRFKDECVNKNIPGRKMKEYYHDNKAKIQKYFSQHKHKINAKRNAKTKCSCGSVISRSRLAKHSKTNKHKQWIQQELEWLSEQKRQLEEDSKLLEQDKHLFD